MFNPSLLSDLVKKAQWDRKLTEFAKICGVSAGNLSKIIAQKDNQAPMPKTLQKIASNALNGITYNQLTFASGYNFDFFINDEEIMIFEKLEHLREIMINSPNHIIDINHNPLSPEAITILSGILDLGVKHAKLINSK